MFDHEQGADSDIMGGQFPVLAALLMLLLDAVLYMLLALYLDIVVPGKGWHRACRHTCA